MKTMNIYKVDSMKNWKHYAFVDSTILFVFLFNNTMHNDVMAHNHVASMSVKWKNVRPNLRIN